MFIYKLLNLNLQDAFICELVCICVGWIHKSIFFNKELSVGNQMPPSYFIYLTFIHTDIQFVCALKCICEKRVIINHKIHLCILLCTYIINDPILN